MPLKLRERFDVGLRERKKQQTRLAILDSADTLFRQRGYEQTRVTDIIEPVQISKKTFFNYFPSKEAVLIELARCWFERYTTEAGEIVIADAGDDPLQKLLTNLNARIEIVIRERDFIAMLVKHTSLFQIHPNLDSLPFDIVSQNFEEILENIRQIQSIGVFRNDIAAEELNQIFMSVRNVIIIQWLLDDKATPEQLLPKINNAIKILLKGFSAEKLPAQPGS